MHTLTKGKSQSVRFRYTWPLHLMLLPGMIILIVYTIVPFFGNVIAFEDFQPIRGFFKSQWVGLENFHKMFLIPDTFRIFRNSLFIASGKLILGLVFGVIFAILLNEGLGVRFKKGVQTICFLPHFLSWVILATVFRNLLDSTGVINNLLVHFHLTKAPILFLGSNSFFQGIMVSSDVWKEFGYGAIIFIAALAAVNLELYEAADIDGAGRLQKIWHITLPGIRVTIALVAILNLANIMNAGFDQVFNLYNPVVYKTGDIIDTFVYRMSFINAQYSLATAVGLLKSLLSFILIAASNICAEKFAHYRIL